MYLLISCNAIFAKMTAHARLTLCIQMDSSFWFDTIN